MNTTDWKVGPAGLRARLRQAVADPKLDHYLWGGMLPLLFAVVVSAVVRQHSLAPSATMPRTVANLLTLAALMLFVMLMRGRRLHVSMDGGLLLGALAIASTISVMGSGSIDFSLLRLQLYLATALLATAVYVGYRDRKSIPLEACFLGISLAHLPFLVAAVLWVRDMKMPYWQDGPRLAQFANVRQYAEFAFLAAVSASAVGLLSRRFVVPSFLLATGAVFAIILTGSRGALLSWMLFMLLACCFSQARLRAAVHGVLVLALSAGVVFYLDRSGALPSPNIFGRIAEQQAGTASFDASRLRIWGQAFDQILARPLFGSGPEGYWLSNCCDRRVLQAHNFVLQFLMEFGVVGCALFVLLGAKAVQALGGVAATARAVMATAANRVLVCVLAAFFGFSLIDQMMYHLLPLLHLAAFAGLFAAGVVQARHRDMNLPRPQ